MTEIPKASHSMLSLLAVLQERGELLSNDAIEGVVHKVGLTDEQMTPPNE